MQFKKIVSVDYTGLEEAVREQLADLAEEVIYFDDVPKSNRQIIERIGDADCVLVSWNTPIDREVIEACPEIKYIGMCCSLYDEQSANVDIATAREHEITVYGVRDYGDEGVMEFILSELVRLFHGFGPHQWKEEQVELTGQKLGIIGLGATGIMLAERAQAFGMEVYYHSRTRKLELEERLGVQYREKEALLREVDILSTHLPKHTIVLSSEDFETFGDGKILINTSLEPTFDVDAFEEWLGKGTNFGIFDKGGMGSEFERISKLENVIYTEKVSGWTSQAKVRLSLKVLENIQRYLNYATVC